MEPATSEIVTPDNRPEHFWEDHAKLQNKVSYPFQPHYFYMLGIVGKFEDFAQTLTDPLILRLHNHVDISKKQLKETLVYFVRLNWLLRNDEAYRMKSKDIQSIDLYESNKFLILGIERLKKNAVHIHDYNKPTMYECEIRNAREWIGQMSKSIVHSTEFIREFGQGLNDSMRDFFMHLSLLSLLVTGKPLSDIATEYADYLKKECPEKFNPTLYTQKD